MDGGSLILLTVSFLIIFILIQRSELKRRRVVIFCMLLVVLLVVWYVNQPLVMLQREALVGFIIAAVLSFLFWLLVGRYNPVGSSDDIRVLGMDD